MGFIPDNSIGKFIPDNSSNLTGDPTIDMVSANKAIADAQVPRNIWKDIGAEVTPAMKVEHPVLSAIASAGQDLATAPANFANQFLLNAPRAVLNKAGYAFPTSEDKRIQNVSSGLGVIGALSNPITIKNPILAGAIYGGAYSNKDNLGLDQKAIMNRIQGAAGGALTGGILSSLGKAFSSGGVINKFIGTRKKDFLFGRNPGQAVADEGIIAANPEDLSSQISNKLSQYGQQINDVVSKSSKNINISDSIKPFDEAINKAATNNEQDLVNRLNDVKTAITNKLGIDAGTGKIQIQGNRNISSLSPLEATEIKRIIGEKAKFTGNPSDDKLVNNVLRQAYGTIRRQIEEAVPEVSSLNQRYADLKVANLAIARKDFTKTPIVGLLGGVGRGALGGFIASHGNPIGAAIGSIAEPLLERATNNARTKTIQAMIYKAGETVKQKALANNQELLGIQNILNQSKNQ